MSHMTFAVIGLCFASLLPVAESADKSGQKDSVTISAGGTADKPLVKISIGTLVLTAPELNMTIGKKDVTVIRAVNGRVQMTRREPNGETKDVFSCTEMTLLLSHFLGLGVTPD